MGSHVETEFVASADFDFFLCLKHMRTKLACLVVVVVS